MSNMKKNLLIIFCLLAFQAIFVIKTNAQSSDFGVYARGVVVINELMVNPSGELGLPDAEYIELYNTTDYDIDISGWSVSVGNKTGIIGDFVLQSDAFCVLCSKTSFDNDLFTGSVIPLSSWPVLTNSEGHVVLRDGFDIVIDVVDYKLSDFENSFKRNGGWSLERIDVANLSGDCQNWTFSTDKSGGTPMTINSVAATYSDIVEPSIQSVLCSDDGAQLLFSFTEPVDPLSISNTITLNRIKMSVISVSVDDETLSRAVVCLKEPLDHRKIYRLDAFSAKDLAGNDLLFDNVRIAIAEDIDINALIINELMVNSSSSNGDYVEVYNRGNEAFDLKQLYYGRIVDGILRECNRVVDYSRLIFPEDCIVICKDSLAIVEKYEPEFPFLVVSNSKFPNLPQDGVFALCLADGTIVDCVAYSQKMHSDLIADPHDVALERIMTAGNSSDQSNWTSAAGLYGFATPTMRNSQNRDGVIGTQNEIEMTTRIFTPNGDGIDDEMIVSFKLGDCEWNATMTIFSSAGLPVCRPYNNRPMPASGQLLWNGTNEDGQLQAPGTYIVLISLYQNAGKTRQWKRSCVITTER